MRKNLISGLLSHYWIFPIDNFLQLTTDIDFLLSIDEKD